MTAFDVTKTLFSRKSEISSGNYNMNKKTAILPFFIVLIALFGCKEAPKADNATIAEEHPVQLESVIEQKSEIIEDTAEPIPDSEPSEPLIANITTPDQPDKEGPAQAKQEILPVKAEVPEATEIKIKDSDTKIPETEQNKPIETNNTAEIIQKTEELADNIDSKAGNSEKAEKNIEIVEATDETGDKNDRVNEIIEEKEDDKATEPEKTEEVVAENKDKIEETEPEKSEEIKTENKTEVALNDEKASDETETPKTVVDDFYAVYNKVLADYIDKDGKVNYSRLRRKRGELFAAVKALDKIEPEVFMATLDKNEKKAFWINAHNLFTLKLIIDNYPIQPRPFMILYPDNSIMQIPGGREKTIFKVIGFEYTLKEIEREQLLLDFKDPRIIFALTYASKGAAFMRNEAYIPDKLDEQLTDQVKRFVSNDKGMKIDRNSNIVYLSDIFNWYKQEIISSKYGKIKKFRKYKPHVRASLNMILDHIDGDDAKYIESQNYTVKFRIFDWHLNEQASKK